MRIAFYCIIEDFTGSVVIIICIFHKRKLIFLSKNMNWAKINKLEAEKSKYYCFISCKMNWLRTRYLKNRYLKNRYLKNRYLKNRYLKNRYLKPLFEKQMCINYYSYLFSFYWRNVSFTTFMQSTVLFISKSILELL